MSKPKKEPIGTCDCPMKGCSHVVPVYRYDGVTDDATRRRFAGRLYTICPSCGRSENQEFIVCNAKMYGPDGAPSPNAKPAPKQSSTPSPVVTAPVTTRAPLPKQPPLSKANWWDNWGTIIK